MQKTLTDCKFIQLHKTIVNTLNQLKPNKSDNLDISSSMALNSNSHKNNLKSSHEIVTEINERTMFICYSPNSYPSTIVITGEKTTGDSHLLVLLNILYHCLFGDSCKSKSDSHPRGVQPRCLDISRELSSKKLLSTSHTLPHLTLAKHPYMKLNLTECQATSKQFIPLTAMYQRPDWQSTWKADRLLERWTDYLTDRLLNRRTDY